MLNPAHLLLHAPAPLHISLCGGWDSTHPPALLHGFRTLIFYHPHGHSAEISSVDKKIDFAGVVMPEFSALNAPILEDDVAEEADDMVSVHCTSCA